MQKNPHTTKEYANGQQILFFKVAQAISSQGNAN